MPLGEKYSTSITNAATAHITAKLIARALIPQAHSEFSKGRSSKKPAGLSFAGFSVAVSVLQRKAAKDSSPPTGMRKMAEKFVQSARPSAAPARINLAQPGRRK